MIRSLYKQGILKKNLFPVEGDLAENYNRVLEKATGKKTQQTTFHIDKRGESPEIEEELGENYLQSGPAHRYCIVVSPEQKHAILLHEEFSFDNYLLDFLYENYFSGISVATRIDGLYGEIEQGVRYYETLEDLLLIKKVKLELHTPSGFLSKARNLQNYVSQLRMNPELLITNDSSVLKMILKLISEVGDVRNYNLTPIKVTKEITTFYTRFFNGVFVFENADREKTVQLKRPENEDMDIDISGDSLTPFMDELNPSQQINPDQTHIRSKAVVIYNKQRYEPEDGPCVQFIPFQDTGRVLDFLITYGYAAYSYELLEARLSRAEERTLIGKGHEVTEMTREQRTRLLHQYRNEMLPEWYELKNIKRQVSKGHKFDKIIHDCQNNIKSILLKTETTEPETAYVIEHLLTKLYPYDYEKMYIHNQRDLGYAYTQADENSKTYIMKKVLSVKF